MYRLINKQGTYLSILLVAAMALLAFSQQKTGMQIEASAARASFTPAPVDTNANNRDLKEAPNFTLEMMNGEMFTLSEHEGQVIALNFWATWCPPCRKEIPHFIEIQKKMRDEGVLFVGISLDVRRGWKAVEPFAKKYGINYPIMITNQTVYRKYGPFQGIPVTFIINEEGKIAYEVIGMVGKNRLKNILEKLTS